MSKLSLFISVDVLGITKMLHSKSPLRSDTKIVYRFSSCFINCLTLCSTILLLMYLPFSVTCSYVPDVSPLRVFYLYNLPELTLCLCSVCLMFVLCASLLYVLFYVYLSCPSLSSVSACAIILLCYSIRLTWYAFH